jgi:hypothetical protein
VYIFTVFFFHSFFFFGEISTRIQKKNKLRPKNMAIVIHVMVVARLFKTALEAVAPVQQKEELVDNFI